MSIKISNSEAAMIAQWLRDSDAQHGVYDLDRKLDGILNKLDGLEEE